LIKRLSSPKNNTPRNKSPISWMTGHIQTDTSYKSDKEHTLAREVFCYGRGGLLKVKGHEFGVYCTGLRGSYVQVAQTGYAKILGKGARCLCSNSWAGRQKWALVVCLPNNEAAL